MIEFIKRDGRLAIINERKNNGATSDVSAIIGTRVQVSTGKMKPGPSFTACPELGPNKWKRTLPIVEQFSVENADIRHSEEWPEGAGVFGFGMEQYAELITGVVKNAINAGGGTAQRVCPTIVRESINFQKAGLPIPTEDEFKVFVATAWTKLTGHSMVVNGLTIGGRKVAPKRQAGGAKPFENVKAEEPAPVKAEEKKT